MAFDLFLDTGSIPVTSTSLRLERSKNEDFHGVVALASKPDYTLAYSLQTSPGQARMYYVYILQSLADEAKYYTGFTNDLKKRIIKHNNGEVPHTNKYKPWKIINYSAFESEEKAIEFEKYLKSHSVRDSIGEVI